jgi:hypothetical protein
MKTGKPKILKSFEKLDKDIREQIKLSYPDGFVSNLISFSKPDGSLVSALPFETEDVYYMVKMTESEATNIIDNDDDYGSDGLLKDVVKEEYEQKYGGAEDEMQDDEEDDSYGDDDVADDADAGDEDEDEDED